MFAFLFCFQGRTQTLSPGQIAALKDVIWSGTQTLHSPDGDTQFNGSYDWHSNVHAYWALLSMARVEADADLEKKMTDIFTIERLKKEYQFLMSPNWTDFERPYGRAWMLLLLRELSFRPVGSDKRFLKIRQTLTQDMLKWLKHADFPEFGSSLIGDHGSWMMSLFLFDTAKYDDPKLSEEIKKLIQKKMMPQANKLENREWQEGDFIYLPSLKYLLNPDHHYSHTSLGIPDVNTMSCHYAGAIQVSLWAYASQCAQKDIASCQYVKSQSQTFYDRPFLWKDDFDCVEHWVPQFMWMTHWLSLNKQ